MDMDMDMDMDMEADRGEIGKQQADPDGSTRIHMPLHREHSQLQMDRQMQVDRRMQLQMQLDREEVVRHRMGVGVGMVEHIDHEALVGMSLNPHWQWQVVVQTIRSDTHTGLNSSNYILTLLVHLEDCLVMLHYHYEYQYQEWEQPSCPC